MFDPLFSQQDPRGAEGVRGVLGGSQKEGWGRGGRLGRALAVSPSLTITVCVQIDPFSAGNLGEMGRGDLKL